MCQQENGRVSAVFQRLHADYTRDAAASSVEPQNVAETGTFVAASSSRLGSDSEGVGSFHTRRFPPAPREGEAAAESMGVGRM